MRDGQKRRKQARELPAAGSRPERRERSPSGGKRPRAERDFALRFRFSARVSPFFRSRELRLRIEGGKTTDAAGRAPSSALQSSGWQEERERSWRRAVKSHTADPDIGRG